MTVDLLTSLSKFQPTNDRETDAAYFRTQVPWIGPSAYLHIVFKPAPEEALAGAARRLAMPKPLKAFLLRHNGAILFSGALSVDGVHRVGQLLNRTDPFLRQPFNTSRQLLPETAKIRALRALQMLCFLQPSRLAATRNPQNCGLPRQNAVCFQQPSRQRGKSSNFSNARFHPFGSVFPLCPSACPP